MNYYPNYNQYYGQNQMQQPTQRYQPMQQPITAPMENYIQQNPIINKPIGLLGKSVDSVDVVKAMDIPLDGSISYFPLTDGTAIVTKQLQADGTSKTIIYKPVEEEKKEAPNYITNEQLEKTLKKIDITELQDEIKEIKKEIKDIKKEMKNKED